MSLKPLLLLPFLVCSVGATPVTYSATANSYYPSPFNEVQADAYINEVAGSFTLLSATTLTFGATYSQTPHICSGDTCGQDLNTSAFTSPGLYFNSAPDKGVCNKLTLAPFPCTATLPAGHYDLYIVINDTTSTPAITGNVVFPFSDTVQVSVDGLSSPSASTPEPSACIITALGLLVLSIWRKRSLSEDK